MSDVAAATLTSKNAKRTVGTALSTFFDDRVVKGMVISLTAKVQAATAKMDTANRASLGVVAGAVMKTSLKPSITKIDAVRIPWFVL